HVGRFSGREDADGGRQAQHRRPSSSERTAPSAGGSKPPVTRFVGPSGIMISIRARSGTGPGASGRTRTGTKSEQKDDSVEGLGVWSSHIVGTIQFPVPRLCEPAHNIL